MGLKLEFRHTKEFIMSEQMAENDFNQKSFWGQLFGKLVKKDL